jgi:hypothetical protein
MKFSLRSGSLLPADTEARQFLERMQSGQTVDLVLAPKPSITDPQRNASHKWFKQVSDLFNEKGLTMDVILRKGVYWNTTGMDFKERIWKVGVGFLFGKNSSEKLEVEEVNDVYEWVCSGIYETLEAKQIDGLVLPPFPSWHNQGEE